MTLEFDLIGSLHLNESLSLAGGAEGYILDLAQSIKNQGIPICLGAGRKEDFLLPEISYIISKIHKITNQSKLSANVENIKNLMDENCLKIIHLHSIYNPDLYYQLVSTFPTIRTVHDSRSVCPTEFRINQKEEVCENPVSDNCLNCFDNEGYNPNLQATKEILEAMAVLDIIITPSQYMKKQLVQNGLPDDKIEVLPPFPTIGLETQNSMFIDEYHTSDVLFLGRAIRSKGLREAIQVMPKIDRKSRLMVCGDGPDLDSCKILAKNLGMSSRVVFTGWVTSKEKSEYLAGTKAVIIPSMGPESFGLVGLEAMFYQKPIVAFDVGGINEWLKDSQNGFLVKRGNINDMAEKLNAILSSENLREQMGINGKRILNSEFLLANHLSKLLRIYSGLKRK